MKLRIRTVLFLLGFLPLVSFGQSLIEGLAPEFKGEKVRVFFYQDFFTKTLSLLGSDSVDNEGKFSINVNNEDFTYVKIQIKNYEAHLHLAPKTNYSVYFAAQGGNGSGSIHKMSADLFFKDLDSSDINFLVRDFNMEYEGFFTTNYQLIAMHMRGNSSGYRKNQEWYKRSSDDTIVKPVQNAFRDTLNGFENRLNAKYASYDNPYFKSYYEYSLASLKLGMKVGRKTIYNDYLRNAPVVFSNIEYYNFVNDYFDKYLLKKVIYDNEQDFKRVIGTQRSLDSLRLMLVKDPLLRNKTLIDHLLIKGLFGLYRQQGYEKTHLAHVLGQLVREGETKQNRDMAQNVMDILVNFQKGGKATDFALMDNKDEIVKLSDFEGEYVFVSFWESWCTTCENEMKMIKELNKRFGSKINFVTINIDENSDYFKKFLIKNKDYNWNFLHIGNQPQITEVYGVKALPEYFIIDKEGDFIDCTGYRMTPDFTGFTMEFLLHKLYKQELKGAAGPLGKRNY